MLLQFSAFFINLLEQVENMKQIRIFFNRQTRAKFLKLLGTIKKYSERLFKKNMISQPEKKMGLHVSVNNFEDFSKKR